MTWHDADMFYLIASGEMASDDLVEVARSLYKQWQAATWSGHGSPVHDTDRTSRDGSRARRWRRVQTNGTHSDSTREIDDAERVSQLMTELGYPTTMEAMRNRLGAIVADPNYATFVADTGACVVGVAGATLGKYYENDGVYCQLLVLSVSSTARGQGTGTRLVETLKVGRPARARAPSSSTARCIAATRTVSTSAGSTPEPVIDSSSS